MGESIYSAISVLHIIATTDPGAPSPVAPKGTLLDEDDVVGVAEAIADTRATRSPQIDKPYDAFSTISSC
jgi:hypothetical protein